MLEGLRQAVVAANRTDLLSAPPDWRTRPVDERRTYARVATTPSDLDVLARTSDPATIRALLERADLPENIQTLLAVRCGLPVPPPPGVRRPPATLPGARPKVSDYLARKHDLLAAIDARVRAADTRWNWILPGAAPTEWGKGETLALLATAPGLEAAARDLAADRLLEGIVTPGTFPVLRETLVSRLHNASQPPPDAALIDRTAQLFASQEARQALAQVLDRVGQDRSGNQDAAWGSASFFCASASCPSSRRRGTVPCAPSPTAPPCSRSRPPRSSPSCWRGM